MSSRFAVALALGAALTVSACGGDDDDGTNPQTQSFTLSVTPATLSVQAGGNPTSIALSSEQGDVAASVAAAGTGTLDVAITRSGGFTGSVTITVEGLPSGVTASALTIPGNATTGTITLTAGATAPVGTSTITVRGTGTGVEARTATVQLTITAAPSFSLTLNPAAISVVQGQSGSSQVNIARAGGFTGTVNLTSTGAPAGMTVAFTPAAATGASAAIAVNVGATVAAGAYPITIQGAGTGVANQTATLTVTVTAPVSSSIALSLAPATVSIQQGQSGTSALTIARTNFTGTVNLTASGAPSGMTVSFNPAAATGTTSTVTVDVGAAVATGNHTVTIQGAGTGIANATTTLTVTVTAPPASSIALALNPAALSIAAGAQLTSSLTITRTNFTGDVTLTSSGAPAGMTVSFNPATVTGGNTTSTITVAVGASVATGVYPVTIQGAGTGISNATTTLTVTVTAAAGSISLSIVPPTLSVQQGASGSTALTILRTNFTGTVNLTSSGAPNGVTVTFNPASTTGTTSTVDVAVAGTVATGNYQITLTGAGTGITNATTTLSLTVTASGGSGNVSFTFCAQSGIPLWVAFSNNGGAWTQVTGVNNVFSLNISPRGIVAYVLPDGTKTRLVIHYGTQQELAATGAGLCQSTGGLKTINVTVNGVAAGELARISMGGGGGAFFGGLTQNPVVLNNVQDGLRDLLGIKSPSATNLSASSIVIQRDLNIANNGNVTVDFATGVAPVSRTSTIANLGSEVGFFNVNFITKNFTAGGLFFDTQASTSLTRTWTGVPDASTVSGDFHVQTVIATQNATTPLPLRAVSVYNRLATNQTLTLPNAIATPPTVTVAGTSPYVTVNSNWVVQSPYTHNWSLSLTPASGNVSSVTVIGTSGYFGSGPVQLNVPTFGAGFNAVWGLQPGILVNWNFFAAGGTVYTGGPAEGAIGNFATVGGSFTP